MNGTVSQFGFGMITPVTAFLMACFGSALGLRCTTRSLRRTYHRGRWLALGSISIGTGIWTMHFIAMIGFSIRGASITYDTRLTFLSLGVAVAVVAVGVFTVGYRGVSRSTLAAAGIFTGVGVAAMHYLGMSSMHVDGDFSFDPVTVAVSVIIAIVAATAALWAAVSLHALWTSVAASAVMGLAVTGMHYTGMAAVSVHLNEHGSAVSSDPSVALFTFLLPVVAGPVAVLIIAASIVMFDPDMLVGQNDDSHDRPAVHAPIPAGRQLPAHNNRHAP
ncbi:MHYT domain-containing protein [Streptomyces sp. NPDC088747]|uniref:MHYT domain-containing protein n=1 Tax=Streptomyces sp. NPDC088747 TaxID=3365886 RepID=UPI00380D60CA